MGNNLTGAKVHTVELMGLQIGKEYYAICVASALTLVAGIYQVKDCSEDISRIQCLWYQNLEQKYPQLALTTTNKLKSTK